MQCHSVTSFETAPSLANGPIMAGDRWGIPRELQRLLSPIGYGSTGSVCERSLTAGKILFTGRETCSLYLVLWLCARKALASSVLNETYVSRYALVIELLWIFALIYSKFQPLLNSWWLFIFLMLKEWQRTDFSQIVVGTVCVVWIPLIVK